MRILAIDQGTSGTKAVVVDDGQVVAAAEETVRPVYLAGGRVERDLSGAEDQIANADGVVVGANGGRALGGLDDRFSHAARE